MDPNLMVNWISIKIPRLYGERMVFLINAAEITRYPFLISNTKINSKWVIDLIVKAKEKVFMTLG